MILIVCILSIPIDFLVYRIEWLSEQGVKRDHNPKGIYSKTSLNWTL
jgi:hypothetical protein